MQEQDLFEYAVIRIVPQVEREEFLNTGVILYCPKQKFLKMRFELDVERLGVFCGTLDFGQIREFLGAFEKICYGGVDAGPIGLLPLPERFRWVTASRSTIVQTSGVHPGLCNDAEEKLNHLFDQLVTHKSS